MPDLPVDPRWPKLLSLAVHEFRTPLTVVSGYIRMLLKDRAGALTDQQRRLLEEAEKSCARLSGLVAEVSELSNLEGGTLTYNRQQTDVRAALRAAVDGLPPLVDREVEIDVQLGAGPFLLNGDPVRLGQAFGSIVLALRREIVGATRLIVEERESPESFEVLVGDPETLAALRTAADRPVFDEWRGGVGLSLATARRILEAHGGKLTGPPSSAKSGARIVLPRG